MKRWLTCAAAAVAAVGGAGSTALAQETTNGPRASRFDLGIYAGGSGTSAWFESRTVTLNGTETPDDNDDGQSYAPGYAPIFGAQATFWLTPAFGVRAHGAYAPVRPPQASEGFFDLFFDNAGERRDYTFNTYLYDLNLALRPFVGRDGWYRTVYLFAGGGGLTVDVAGEDRRQCVGYLLALGACVSYEPEQATVAQGTAGAGIDLIRFGSLGLFGEAAVHVYDSPAHVDDAWVGPITAPSGARVRIADDRTAATVRLVAGLKLALGELLPPPQVEIPPPPPPAVLPPPPPPALPPPPATTRVCVVQGGALTEIEVTDPASVQTTGEYAGGAPWFINNEPITFGGRRYVKYGLPRVVGVTELGRVGDYQGVGVFGEAGGMEPREVIYVPVRPGCEFQPYQLERKATGVRG